MMSIVRGPHPVLGAVLAACLAGALSGCGGGGQARLSPTGGVASQRHVLLRATCEKNPKDGVHGPDRLKVLEHCARFQGTVSEAPAKNPDGDVSFDASPDPGYESMLNAVNRSKDGLHIEIVPRDQPGCTPGKPVHVGDVPGLGICSGRDLAAPALGTHVRVIGAWVRDLNNNWNEIHPVWSIKILRPSAKPETSVVLGKKQVRPNAVGFGTTRPRLIFNGGGRSGRAWHLRWRDWGTVAAYAHGLTWIVSSRGGYYRNPGRIELRASRIRRCSRSGPLAYTFLQARTALRPGGRLGHWLAWGGWKSACTGRR
jgi:hypothetical protein